MENKIRETIKEQLADNDNINVELLNEIIKERVKNIIFDYNREIREYKQHKRTVEFIFKKENYVDVDDFKYLHLDKNDKLIRINNIRDDEQRIFDVMFLNLKPTGFFEYSFDFDNIFIKFKNEDKFRNCENDESDYIFDYISFMNFRR